MFDNEFNIEYYEELRYSDDYNVLRNCANEYLRKCNKVDLFISQYEFYLSRYLLESGLDVVTSEKHYLWYLYISLVDENQDLWDNDKGDSTEMRTNEMISTYVFSKLLKHHLLVTGSKEIERLKHFGIAKKKIISTKLSLEGKPLNLLDRFTIVNKVFDIEKNIRKLKISEDEKHNVLSLVLGCNKDNAKKIMNGNYDAKLKEDLIDSYVKTLKK
ncbi:hypothetical protein [Winogradskyella poriferorum]|uniref:hypothetical protein n=1 Tax=Winogradskyella poriferorum TaxID=307627 RepID=UPI003D660761